MKKNILLFIFCILLASCAPKNEIYTEILCPKTYISTEHQKYFQLENNNYEDISYVVTINNFKNICKQKNDENISSILDILFLVKPLKPDVKKFQFYYFVSILDDNDKILDYQIFDIEDTFHIDKNKFPKVTEVINTLDQYFPIKNNNFYKIVIGLVLDKDKYNYLNN